MLVNPGDSLEEIWSNTVLELHRGALDNKHPFRYVSLGTLSSGKIRLRYVVLRKVDNQLNFYIFTDSRSEKVRDLKSHPAASLLFYHPQKRTQIRVEGECDLHHKDELTDTLWPQVGEQGKKSYGSIMPPGEQILYPEMAHNWSEEITPDNFTVILLKSQLIEVLQLNKAEHFRIRYIRAGEEWRGNWLVP